MGEPEPHHRTELIHRIGTFFLMIGVGLLIIFILSESGGRTMFEYFCGSIILISLGFVFRAQHKRSVHESGRFSIFKRIKKGKEE